MIVEHTPLNDVLLCKPVAFDDQRGFFLESYKDTAYTQYNIPPFVQWNHSRSSAGVLRGIHIQYPYYQGKLVYVIRGAIYDVAVDLRKDSSTYGQHYAIELNDSNHYQLWIPEGFGHAFYTISPTADVLYGCTSYYEPTQQYSIQYNDPDLAIDWKTYHPCSRSSKDEHAPLLRESPFYFI